MGLDLVELMMEVEDEFGIRIPDADAEVLETVGRTYYYVLNQLARRAPAAPWACASQHAFHEVRRGLAEEWDVARRRVRPDALFIDLIPPGHRVAVWSRLVEKLDLPRPPFSIWKPFAGSLPPPGTRVRDIVNQRLERKPTRYFRKDGRVDEAAVWAALLHIVAGTAGVKEERLRKDTHYINDLGLD